MRSIMALHVRYISLPFSAKQSKQLREWPNSALYGEREHSWAHEGEFAFPYLNSNAVLTNTDPG